MAIEREPGAALAEAIDRMRGCERCPALVASRTGVVCGEGAPGARILVVSDAPRTPEDVEAVPLAGRARELLDRLLLEAGCLPEDRYLTSLAKCRPPDSRAPSAAEVAGCSGHLETEVDLIGPLVVVALGGLVAGVLRGRPASIRAIRGREEPCLLGSRPVWLLPAFHPAAALYDPGATRLLGEDLARLPALLERGRPVLEPEPEPEAVPVATGPGQLGLF